MTDLKAPTLDVGMLYGYTEYLKMWELQRGIIRLYDTIGETMTGQVGRECNYLLSYSQGIDNVYAMISSPGGGVYYAFCVYDQLCRLNAHIPVTTHVEGWAASAACMIVLQAGRHRVAAPHSRFLLHEIRQWVFFELERKSDVDDKAREMKALEAMIIGILASRCGRTEEEVLERMSRQEVWMSAQEALEWGLIDEIEEIP